MSVREWWSATALLLVLAALPCASARADEHTDHAHEPVAVDPELTLDAVVDAALAAYPKAPELDARQSQADAWARRGRSLIGDRPSLMLRYQSDRWGSDNGLDEYEAGIELPFWSWGGRSAVRDYGEALLAESGAARSALRWEVAGVVRDALWEVALAENAHDLAEQSLATSARLLEVVQRRYDLGDVAERDVLLARSSYLEYQTALTAAGAGLTDAERFYRIVTGLGRRPQFVAEPLSDIADITAEHPALAFADLAVERAAADVEVMRRTGNAGASVLIGTRRERPAFGTTFDDSIGVTVNVPFGGGAHRETEVSAAARAASEARAARNQAVRDLTLRMHEAAHNLTVIRENVAAASQRLDIAIRQETMGELAYEKGELELMDLLRIRETTLAARRHAARLQIEEKRQTALYNQAAGVLP